MKSNGLSSSKTPKAASNKLNLSHSPVAKRPWETRSVTEASDSPGEKYSNERFHNLTSVSNVTENKVTLFEIPIPVNID